ncbi:MAG: hypothetical protein BWY09_03078 [Candidatus Hydrogenedentes bacterium ADurb.Bin179]|nr:MAG: hypothetical protein BWY09_03078 [Candidatus Hydrogenedentes bacterium ADurb.Bin179]
MQRGRSQVGQRLAGQCHEFGFQVIGIGHDLLFFLVIEGVDALQRSADDRRAVRVRGAENQPGPREAVVCLHPRADTFRKGFREIEDIARYQDGTVTRGILQGQRFGVERQQRALRGLGARGIAPEPQGFPGRNIHGGDACQPPRSLLGICRPAALYAAE